MRIQFYQYCISQYQENYTALHLAVESGKHSVVETLLGQGAQVHIQGDIPMYNEYIDTNNRDLVFPPEFASVGANL